MKKAGIMAGILFLCSGMILAGEDEEIQKEVQKEYKIVLNQDEGDGYLGVFLRDVTPEDVEELGLPEERGVFLVEIAEDSPAEKAGLQKGDVIVEYQSLPVMSVKQFQRMVGDTPPGRNSEIKLFRDKRAMNLTAEIGKGNPSRRVIQKFGMPGPHIEGDNRIFKFKPGTGDGYLEFLPDLMDGLSWGKPLLGIEGAAMTRQMADYMGIDQEEGVLVMNVLADSPAEKAGIKAGDVITAVNGKEVGDPRELRNSLKKETIDLSLIRNRNKMSLSVEIKPPKEKNPPKETIRM